MKSSSFQSIVRFAQNFGIDLPFQLVGIGADAFRVRAHIAAAETRFRAYIDPAARTVRTYAYDYVVLETEPARRRRRLDTSFAWNGSDDLPIHRARSGKRAL